MRTIHWTGVLLLIIAYMIGAKYPIAAHKIGLV